MKFLPLLLSMFLALLGCLSVNTACAPDNPGSALQVVIAGEALSADGVLTADEARASDKMSTVAGVPTDRKSPSPGLHWPNDSVLSKGDAKMITRDRLHMPKQ